MKKISIVTSCFNEEDNITLLYKKLKDIIEKLNSRYNFEIIFIDNASTDFTQDELRKIANEDKNVKLILNSRNFGSIKSPYYAICQATGDAIIYLASDLQDPPEMIDDFIENGNGDNGNVAFVELDDMPKYNLCLLKRGITTNDEEIYQKIAKTGTTYYKYYAYTKYYNYFW